MVKEIVRSIILFGLFIGILGFSGGKKAEDEPTPLLLPPSSSVPSASLLWSKKVPGSISGMSASEGAKAILVASSPDPDIEGSSNRYLLSWYNAKGHLVWQKKMDAPVREQDVASDGSLAVISNYSAELLVWNAQGKRLWS